MGQLLEVQRLPQEIHRPPAHRLHSSEERGAAAHHDHRDLWILLAELGQQIQPVDLGHHHIHDDGLDGMLRQGLLGLGRGLGDQDTEACLL